MGTRGAENSSPQAWGKGKNSPASRSKTAEELESSPRTSRTRVEAVHQGPPAALPDTTRASPPEKLRGHSGLPAAEQPPLLLARKQASRQPFKPLQPLNEPIEIP